MSRRRYCVVTSQNVVVATDAKRCREEENGGKARRGRRGEKEEVRERRGATEESAVQCKLISSSGYKCDDKIYSHYAKKKTTLTYYTLTT